MMIKQFSLAEWVVAALAVIDLGFVTHNAALVAGVAGIG
jgi:hypothetical protein